MLKTTGTLAIGISLALGMMASPANAEESITFSSWGGSFQEAERKAFLDPAEKALGITIKEDTLNGLADLRAQVQSGSPQWDIAELGSNSCAQAVAEGIVEPLDYNVINTDGIDKAVIGENWIGIIYYATVMGWNTNTYGNNPPKDWADFFNTDKFPGTRSMYAKPYYNLEAALLADGVAPKDLYPLDVERAFALMEKIKPHVSVWWKSGAQSAQLVKDGEVDMLNVWNGRIGNAMKDGAKGDYTFNGALLDYDCLVIPKGAKNVELAMKAINEFMKPENQAELPFHIDYGPVNAKAFDVPNMITPEMAKKLPSAPENASRSVIFSATYWVGRMNELQERFDLFIQE